MRRFIVLVIVFFFPIILIAVCSEILLRKIPNDYSYKRKYLDSNSPNVEVLVLGSSHAFYGVDPQYFKLKCFNASDISQTLDYDYEIFKRYNAKWNNLKFVLLPIDDFTLYSDLKTGVEPWRVKNYEIYYDIHLSNDIVDQSEVLSNDVNVNCSRLYFYYIVGYTNITCSKLGWGQNYHSSDDKNLVASGKTAAERHTALTDEHFKHNVQILTELIELAKAKNIKVILYTSPAYKTYVTYASKNQISSNARVIKSLVEKYSNTSYYNWFTDESFLPGDFYDADHFNEIGAKKFSVKVDSVISVIK